MTQAERAADREAGDQRNRRAVEQLADQQADQGRADRAQQALQRRGGARDMAERLHRQRAGIRADQAEAAHGQRLQRDEAPDRLAHGQDQHEMQRRHAGEGASARSSSSRREPKRITSRELSQELDRHRPGDAGEGDADQLGPVEDVEDDLLDRVDEAEQRRRRSASSRACCRPRRGCSASPHRRADTGGPRAAGDARRASVSGRRSAAQTDERQRHRRRAR